MGSVVDLMRRVGSATREKVGEVFHALGETPIHCYRCRQVFTLADGELTFLHDIPPHRSKWRLFCRDCATIIRAEYQYICGQCGERHNRATSPICAECQVSQYPREAKRVADQNMRARDHGAAATLTVPEWLQTLDDWKWSCCFCGRPFQALDHHLPIALGGGTTAENCFPICNRCNSMKGAFHPDDLLRPSPRSPEAHRRLQEYKRSRWPQAPGDIADPSVNGQQLLPGEGVDM